MACQRSAHEAQTRHPNYAPSQEERGGVEYGLQQSCCTSYQTIGPWHVMGPAYRYSSPTGGGTNNWASLPPSPCTASPSSASYLNWSALRRSLQSANAAAGLQRVFPASGLGQRVAVGAGQRRRAGWQTNNAYGGCRATWSGSRRFRPSLVLSPPRKTDEYRGSRASSTDSLVYV